MWWQLEDPGGNKQQIIVDVSRVCRDQHLCEYVGAGHSLGHNETGIDIVSSRNTRERNTAVVIRIDIPVPGGDG